MSKDFIKTTMSIVGVILSIVLLINVIFICLHLSMGINSTKPMATPETVKNLVNSLIKTKKVVVFSKSYCPYCTKAKKAFEKYSIATEEYVVLEIENREDCNHIQNYLQELTGASSVPRVFINGQFIGGGDDTVRLDANGQLLKMLEDCNALTK